MSPRDVVIGAAARRLAVLERLAEDRAALHQELERLRQRNAEAEAQAARCLELGQEAVRSWEGHREELRATLAAALERPDATAPELRATLEQLREQLARG